MEEHRSLNILMVEDDDLDIQLLKLKFLREKVVNTVDVRSSVESTLAYLKTNPPLDLIFLDLNLPAGRPEEVIEYVKKSPNYARTVITVVTASGDINNINKMQELGVRNYIIKPLNFEKMNQVVQSIPDFYWLAVTPKRLA